MKALEFIQTNKAYFEDFVSRSTYHTNSIEGSTLTLGQTYALLFGDNSMQIHATPREIFEAINHKKAMMALFETMNSEEDINQHQMNLSEQMIKEINEIINADILNTEGYRKVSVMIRGASEFPLSPEQVPNLMMYFVDNYNHFPISDEASIFNKVAAFHIEFEKIHPFEDGNGRTGRLLINFELLKNGIAPIVIPIEKRAEYFEFINQKDINGLASMIESLSHEEKVRMDRMIEIAEHEAAIDIMKRKILGDRINDSKQKYESQITENKKEPNKVQEKKR